MCRRLQHNDIVHNAMSYLISSSSSSLASIAAEIATRCLPWAQRRQLLIYRDRTTEPLTPASTRSIPIVLVILPTFPAFFSLYLSFSIHPRGGVRRRIRFEVDLSLLPWHRTLYARRSPKGSWMRLLTPPTIPETELELRARLRVYFLYMRFLRWFLPTRHEVTLKTTQDLSRILIYKW